MGIVHDSVQEILYEDSADSGIVEEMEWHHGHGGPFPFY